MDKLIGFGGITLISACLLSSCAFGGNNEKSNINQENITMSEITVNTRDNLNVSLQFFAPKNQEKLPTVVLLHMLGKDKSSWNIFIPELLNNGFAVCSVDLRGHGRSTSMQNGREIFYQSMNESDWNKIPDDIIDIINFISLDKLVNPEKIAVIGASVGANSAIIAASEYPDKIKTVVALSPGLNFRGLKTLEPAKNLKVPILFAVAKGDNYSYESSNQLNEVVKTSHDLLVYNKSEHGTNLLDDSKELQGKIIDWLNEYLKK